MDIVLINVQKLLVPLELIVQQVNANLILMYALKMQTMKQLLAHIQDQTKKHAHLSTM